MSISSPNRDNPIIVDRVSLATTPPRPLAFCPPMAYNGAVAAAGDPDNHR